MCGDLERYFAADPTVAQAELTEPEPQAKPFLAGDLEAENCVPPDLPYPTEALHKLVTLKTGLEPVAP